MTTATAPAFDLDDTLKSRILRLAERRGASPAQLVRDALAALEKDGRHIQTGIAVSAPTCKDGLPSLDNIPKKRLGLLEGKLHVPDDFDAPLPPEILAAFEGGGQ